MSDDSLGKTEGHIATQAEFAAIAKPDRTTQTRHPAPHHQPGTTLFLATERSPLYAADLAQDPSNDGTQTLRKSA